MNFMADPRFWIVHNDSIRPRLPDTDAQFRILRSGSRSNLAKIRPEPTDGVERGSQDGHIDRPEIANDFRAHGSSFIGGPYDPIEFLRKPAGLTREPKRIDPAADCADAFVGVSFAQTKEPVHVRYRIVVKECNDSSG